MITKEAVDAYIGSLLRVLVAGVLTLWGIYVLIIFAVFLYHQLPVLHG